MSALGLSVFRFSLFSVAALVFLLPSITVAQGAPPDAGARPPTSGTTQSDSAALSLDEAITLGGPETRRKGFDFSSAFTAEHDSGTGWSNLLTSTLAYRFTPVFSSDISFPFYLSRTGYRNATKKNPSPKPHQLMGEAGDLVLATHAEFHPSLLDYTATVAMTVPTANSTYGLTSGRITYNVNNHFEREYGRLSPELELGLGDSSSLNNRRVKRIYTTLGTLAYFQSGAGVSLPLNLEFEAGIYEQLPVGNQKVYTTVLRKKKKVQHFVGVAASEDNGFNLVLSMPIRSRFSLSTYYNHSMRQNDDVTGITLTAFARSRQSND